MNTWILVTNSSEARLCGAENFRVNDLRLIQEFSHPESRKKVTDLIADRKGHSTNDTGGGNSYEGKHDPKEVEAEHFALQLAKQLIAGFEKKQYDQLIVVAPAHFFAYIRKHIHVHINDITNIPKDFTKYPLLKLNSAIKKHLFG